MKECKWSKNGMKMLIDTGWKEFDRQTNYIGTGNVSATTQYSGFIRPWKERECNNFVFPEGHLTKCDILPFTHFQIPQTIEKILLDQTRSENVILYMFYTHDKFGVINPFCWVVTDYNDTLVKRCVIHGYKENYQKRYKASNEILQYITNC